MVYKKTKKTSKRSKRSKSRSRKSVGRKVGGDPNSDVLIDFKPMQEFILKYKHILDLNEYYFMNWPLITDMSDTIGNIKQQFLDRNKRRLEMVLGQPISLGQIILKKPTRGEIIRQPDETHLYDVDTTDKTKFKDGRFSMTFYVDFNLSSKRTPHNNNLNNSAPEKSRRKLN